MSSFASWLLSHGVKNAINFDGGGSATFVVNGTIVNHPSDPWWVNGALFFTSNNSWALFHNNLLSEASYNNCYNLLKWSHLLGWSKFVTEYKRCVLVSLWTTEPWAFNRLTHISVWFNHVSDLLSVQVYSCIMFSIIILFDTRLK